MGREDHVVLGRRMVWLGATNMPLSNCPSPSRNHQLADPQPFAQPNEQPNEPQVLH